MCAGLSVTIDRVHAAHARGFMDLHVGLVREGDYSQQQSRCAGTDEIRNAWQPEPSTSWPTRLQQLGDHGERQFVSDASHELKTPLASIKLLSDSILQNEMDTETRCANSSPTSAAESDRLGAHGAEAAHTQPGLSR